MFWVGRGQPRLAPRPTLLVPTLLCIPPPRADMGATLSCTPPSGYFQLHRGICQCTPGKHLRTVPVFEPQSDPFRTIRTGQT